MNFPIDEIGPGWWAFVAFFFLAIALWLLMRNMFTRLRRMRLADEQRAREAESSRDPQEQQLADRARGIDLTQDTSRDTGTRRRTED